MFFHFASSFHCCYREYSCQDKYSTFVGHFFLFFQSPFRYFSLVSAILLYIYCQQGVLLIKLRGICVLTPMILSVIHFEYIQLSTLQVLLFPSLISLSVTYYKFNFLIYSLCFLFFLLYFLFFRLLVAYIILQIYMLIH